VPADRFQTMDEFKSAILGETVAGAGKTSRYTARYRTAGGKAQRTTNRRITEIVIGILVLSAVAYGGKRLVDRKAQIAVGTDANKVAVLYFDDGGSGSLRYLADGLTESLIDRLSTVSALDVISKDGVRPYRGKSIPSDSIGRALQVGSIVQGSVEGSGSKVRVTVHLVDAASNADISRKSFEVDTSQVLSAQSQLATQVVDFLREHVGNEVRLREERAETGNSQAWTLVERAEKLRKDADSLVTSAATDAALATIARADSMLVSAGQLDPQWSKVPARRAALSYLRARQLAKEPPLAMAALDSGVAQADRALALQPNSADAYEIKGQLQYLRYQQRVDVEQTKIDRLLPAAESSLTKAVELNREQAGAWATLSSLDYSKPDIQAANAAALAAYNADAYLSLANPILKRLFSTSHDLEQFPEAMKWCNEGKRRFPADPYFTECRLLMYTTRYERPDMDSVWIYRKQFVLLEPATNRAYFEKMGDILAGGALARAGLPDSARHVLVRARATPQEDPERELEGFEAVMRVMLGDQDEAVRLIADYLAANPAHRKGFATRTGWWWRDLQGNPKFKALLAGAR
jgi:TolB-like protein